MNENVIVAYIKINESNIASVRLTSYNVILECRAYSNGTDNGCEDANDLHATGRD